MDAVHFRGRVFFCVLATLMFFSLFSASDTYAAGNNMGINLGGTTDYMGERLYADIIKMSRSFNQVNTSANGPKIAVDSNGWPLSDTSFYTWAGIDQMNGTYTLSFSGKAIVNASSVVGTIPLTYDTGSNTSQGSFQYTVTGSYFMFMNFKNTYRDPTSPINSGVTNIKLMRPTYPGSPKSYDSSVLFTKEIQDEVAKFGTIRFMDFLATNWSMQQDWADRPVPSDASFNRYLPGNGWQGKGGPWEHVILLANLTKKDAWINIPAKATDAYVLNVANMFKYGSDGVNPYTTVQKNPVYPPLDAGLKVYVEYSNEVWNGSFQQQKDNCKIASDDLVSKINSTGVSTSALNYDKSWNGVVWGSGTFDYQKCWRQVANRTVQISDMFRKVFGDTAMMTRIRPVLESQQGDGQATLSSGLGFIFNYYNNAAGPFRDAPHPPSYYLYGAGGSSYWANNNRSTLSSVDAFFADPGVTPAGWLAYLQKDANIVTAMGLKRVAYE